MKPGQPLKVLADTYDVLRLMRELEWLHKRINEVFTVGQIILDRVLTAAGVTGARTIDKVAGSVNFAAGATSLVVTNSLVDENSLIYCVLMTNDTTAVLKNVVPTRGSFTITLSAAATAETRCGFLVLN